MLVANAREGELDLQAIRYGSQLRQNNLNTQAAIARFSGKQAKTASYIGAAGGLVSGLYGTYERGVQIGAIPSDFL